jgi:hypothetical protein
MTKKTLKRGLIALGAVVIISGAFAFGSLSSKADSGWRQDVVTKANSEIGQAGYDKKNEIIQNLDTAIDNRIGALADNKIEEKKDEVTQQLEDYFNSKVDSIANTSEFTSLDGEFETLAQSIIDRYKRELDTAFANR